MPYWVTKLLYRVGRAVYVRSLVDLGYGRKPVSDELDQIEYLLPAAETFQLTEAEVLNKRLSKAFDPAAAWNESVNRAIAAKKAARETINMPHELAFALQQKTTLNALRNA
jgi:hypothetical protein